MDKQEIKSVWAAYLEVQEAKKKLDPVGQEDGDIDNDGDEDSSDEYLKNRRKKIGKAMKKDDKKKDDDDDADDVKESEESPYPSLDKKKREKKGSNLEPAGGPADKLKGAVGEAKKIERPKCEGDGCKHCDDTGYHMKEDYEYFIESLTDEELDEYIDWLNEDEQLDELSADTYYKAAERARMKRRDAVKSRGDNQKARNRHYDHMDTSSTESGREHHADKIHSHERKRDNAAAASKKARGQEQKFRAAAAKKRANEEVELDELSNKTLKSYSKKAKKTIDYHDDRYVNAKPGSAERAKHGRKLTNRIMGTDRADQKRFDRKNPVESTNMDRYVDALRSIPNDQLDELSAEVKSRAVSKRAQQSDGHADRANQYKQAGAKAAKRGNFAAAKEAGKKAAHHTAMAKKTGDKFDKALARAKLSSSPTSDTQRTKEQPLHHKVNARGNSKFLGRNKTRGLSGSAVSGHESPHKQTNRDQSSASKKGQDYNSPNRHGANIDSKGAHYTRTGKEKSTTRLSKHNESTAYDIINAVLEMRQHARLQDVLSGHELAAIEEKMKQPNDTGGKGEPFMSTNSAGEKKFYGDHQKSDKKFVDMEDQGHDDVSKAGRAVKSQASTRRGEKRSGDLAMPTPTKAKGQ